MRRYFFVFVSILAVITQANKLTIGVISDIHYNPNNDYSKENPNINQQEPYSLKENPYGIFGQQSPFLLVKSAFQQIKTTISNPNLFLLLGDYGDPLFQHSPKEIFNLLKYKKQKHLLTNITQEAINTLKTPILFCFGNHDFPYNNEGPKDDIKNDFYSYYYNLWIRDNPYLKIYSSQENYKSFHNGGYYSIIINNFKFIVLNTVYMSVECHSTFTSVVDDQLVWIEKQLKDAYNAGQKAILVMHAPVGRFFSLFFKTISLEDRI